jgi:hypothetical protein
MSRSFGVLQTISWSSVFTSAGSDVVYAPAHVQHYVESPSYSAVATGQCFRCVLAVYVASVRFECVARLNRLSADSLCARTSMSWSQAPQLVTDLAYAVTEHVTERSYRSDPGISYATRAGLGELFCPCRCFSQADYDHDEDHMVPSGATPLYAGISAVRTVQEWSASHKSAC